MLRGRRGLTLFVGMRAGFSDPQGPLRWRVLPYAAVLPPLLFAVVGPADAPSTLAGVSAFALFHFLGVFDWRQSEMRNVELELGPGFVLVKGAGSRSQRVVFADIVGATTARTADGFLLTLQHRKRRQPITLKLETAGDIDAVRRLLGIGHDGFGVVAWPTEASTEERTERGARIAFGVAALLMLPLLVLGAWEPNFCFTLLFLSALFVAFFARVARFVSAFVPPRGVAMTAEGLEVRMLHESSRIPYTSIADVRAHDEAIALLVHPPDAKPVASTRFVRRASRRLGGLSDEDTTAMIAQIRAASQRAHGFGTAKDDATSRLDVLRPNGQSIREWLVRLDTTAQMLAEGSGYRGTTVASEDLWAVLEDPDADTLLRTAAARILGRRREPMARLRIDTTLATIRDEGTSQRIRIAVNDDLDAASRALEALDPSPTAEDLARIKVL